MNMKELLVVFREMVVVLEKLAPYAEQRAASEDEWLAKYARADFQLAREMIKKANTILP